MAVKIGSNISSLQAQRRLGDATTTLSKTYERLSSGQRINQASDDAAGLAIAKTLDVKSKIFGQAVRNINDGISVTAIADSTVQALTEIAQREKELAAQSANGTYSNKQREAMDNEAQELAKEYFRVSRSAQFNGQRLFDGSMGDGLRLQLGVGIDGSIHTKVGGSLGTGEVSGDSFSLVTESLYSRAVKTADLNGDGVLDLVTAGPAQNGYGDLWGEATIRLGRGDGSFGILTSYTMENSNARSCALSLTDLNSDGILDLITAGSDNNSGETTIRLGQGDGTFGESTSYTTEGSNSNALSLADLNGDGVLDLVTAGTNGGFGEATIRLGQGDGTFGELTSYSTEGTESLALSLSDLNGDGVLDLVTAGYGGGGKATIRLGRGDGTFGGATSCATESGYSQALALSDLNGDGVLDLVTAGVDDISGGMATIQLGRGDGSFEGTTSYTTEGGWSAALSLSDLNGDEVLDLVTAGYGGGRGLATIRLGRVDGTFGGPTSYTTESSGSWALSLSDLNGDGVLDLVTAGNEGGGKATIRFGLTRDGISPIEPFSLKTKADALQAIGLFDKTLNNLALIRGTIGANQSRLETALGGIVTSRENYIAAGSRITDADVAQESAILTRTQILQQAASAVLAQANQGPALALTLLR